MFKTVNNFFTICILSQKYDTVVKQQFLILPPVIKVALEQCIKNAL